MSNVSKTQVAPRTLSGKVALITGGSRGIGAAIAQRLARDGATVAITYTSSPQKAGEVAAAIESEGGRVLAIRADSADAEAVKSAVAQTVKAFGRLDILVNNAGVATMAPIDQFSLEEFDRLIAINVKGLFVATQEAVRHMGEGGRIINVGSVNSDFMPFAGGSVYALSKGAVASFTRGLARDLGPRGITVNNVQPGPVDTDMNPAKGPFADSLRGYMALQRYGQGEEVAGMVAYLASPDAAFVTGANLKIDGGFTA
ncbi:3-oxoacyl-ACP reductase family protein [Vitiosangium sp. GDMCC 1.1324]|uniref:3-oxoacyl-ACP reductase family protein n=1 Tax=Vitiosangium sp. (strain GDMCC 1.1324) TaxID=2138576 RepID=UPI000D3424D3|nr:3-oxoacyl-ACP reductase family protein [Vitiosangium sp. GDMCC 1.1324]PTL75535.1 oxidoreductase [Vitiosangium sp. GDMCC 1.1324]